MHIRPVWSCSTHQFTSFCPRSVSYNAETDLHSFGGSATRLGPRIILHNKIENRYSTTYHYYFEHKNRATDSMDIDEKMSDSDIMVIGIENARRMMTERISDAIFLTQAEKKNNTVITVPDPDPKGAPSRTRPPDDKEVVSCPRYQEIRGYLLNNRNELALDTITLRCQIIFSSLIFYTTVVWISGMMSGRRSSLLPIEQKICSRTYYYPPSLIDTK
jgi:hypothetical protein